MKNKYGSVTLLSTARVPVDRGGHVKRQNEDDEEGKVPGGQHGQCHQDPLSVHVAVPTV